MKLNVLVATSQINSDRGKLLGTGSVEGIRHLAEIMVACGIEGDIYDLPNGSRNVTIASPFSLTNGFALTTDELNVLQIPELSLDKNFQSHVVRLSEIYSRNFRHNRTVSYTLKRTVMPWILERCYQLFKEERSNKRLDAYRRFLEVAAYWLDHFALYETYRENGTDLNHKAYGEVASSLAKHFRTQHAERIEFYKYAQFLCYEQRTSLHEDLRRLGVGLIVNLPFGVEIESADLFFHPEVFVSGLQVGCSPEPEHGFPEQAWGVAVYRERSADLQKYLSEKMKWLSHFGDGVFLDHLVGWCGQYVVPLKIVEGSEYPYGHFLTEVHRERKENLTWFFEIIERSGLQIRGEVAGDRERVKATREVMEEFRLKGRNISAMAIPRWETEQDRLLPLARYQPSTLMMVETHDTSTLLQYLLNRKGYFDDFEAPVRILEFCNRVLGLPFFLNAVPLTIEGCGESFWLEICRRLCQGTVSTDVVFTLPSLISVLGKQYRSATIENNINIQPGTSGAVGNGWRNWSYLSPPIEAMQDDPDLKSALSLLGKRCYRLFDYFHDLDLNLATDLKLEVKYSKPAGRAIVYQNRTQRWETLDLAQHQVDHQIKLELLIANLGEKELWHRINLSDMLAMDQADRFYFQDLNSERECYVYGAADLKANLLFIKLQPGQIHHFLVYTHTQELPIPFTD